jgi:MAM domain, meprin/A5/mu/Ig-like domain CHU_C associated/Secretion system C-terminal sorting domain
MKKLLLFFSAILLGSGVSIAQCTFSGVQFGSGSAPGPGSTLTVTTCAYAGEYQVLSGVLAGNSFTVTNTGGASNFITIYDASFTPIFWGSSPVSFTAPTAGTYYSQVNLTGCATDFACHTVVWTNTTPPPPCPSLTTPMLEDVESHVATTSLGISNCWTNSSSTSFNWNITGIGTTPSSGTGANAANSGVKYFYTEASGAALGAEAILISPDIDLSGVTQPMLSFYYHMFGAQIGTLFVEISNNGGTSWNPLTSIVGAQQLSQAEGFLLNETALTGYTGTVKIRFRAVSGGSFEGDICIDDIAVIEAPVCVDPSVPTLTSSSPTICVGNSSTLTITGTLNDATTWEIYDDACGGNLLGSTSSSSFVVSPTDTTTYYVRGVGACVTPGTCSSITVNVNPLDDASFNYSGSTFCANDSDPSPTITGLSGGTFSSGAGLSINAGTGTIEMSTSTPGPYTVTYTTAGTCPNSSNTSVTLNALDDASFNYSGATYCENESDQSPTISGLTGGTFSSGAGLSINTGTGMIEMSTSTPGTYTVTYTTAGTCPNTSNQMVTLNPVYLLNETNTICSGDSYTFPDGTVQNNITAQVIYTSNLETVGNLCDSIIVTTVNVNAIDLSITQTGTTLTANNAAAVYQWLDCNDSYAVLSGETNQSFTATLNGSYAVEITDNGCVDTTACTTISTIGIIENSFDHELTVYPNPTNRNFSIDLGTTYENSQVSITDLTGKLIESKNFNKLQILNLTLEQPAGIYIVSIKAGNKSAVIRMIKK